MNEFQIPFGDIRINALFNPTTTQGALALLILAHGAGAPMSHPFLENLTSKLVDHQISVLRFNFPYVDAGRKSPGNPKPNMEAWKAIIKWALGNYDLPIFLSGKSYGGRMVSHILTEKVNPRIKGVIYFGFPLHAPGKESIERGSHLKEISIPQLFLQGTNDAFAKRELLHATIEGLTEATIGEIKGGDHSFKVKGRKEAEVINELANYSASWIPQKI